MSQHLPISLPHQWLKLMKKVVRGWSSGVEKVKAICCRGDDDGKSSDASSIKKCGSLEICPPCVRTLPPLVCTPPPLVHTLLPLVHIPPPLVCTLPPLILTFSFDDCLSVSMALGEGRRGKGEK